MFITDLNQNNLAFTALPLARTRTCVNNTVTELSVYMLTKKDLHFIKKLPEKIEMDKNFPGLSESAYKRWHEMLEIAADKAALADRKTLLVTKNDIPCGIMTFKSGKNIFEIDAVCTWAIEMCKKVPFAGKVLFNELFKIFEKSKARRIILQAITDGPFPTEPVYKKLGFIPTGSEGSNKINMEFSVSRLKNILNNLSSVIKRTDFKNPEDIRIENLLHINI